MTTYLLDTNICIYIAKHNPPAVRERFAKHTVNELAMSVITLGELCHGAEKSQFRDRALATINILTQNVQIAPMTDTVSQHYGQIRAELEKSGNIIGNNDLWIAAHARSENWILVTNNEREFQRVSGLHIENWTT